MAKRLENTQKNISYGIIFQLVSIALGVVSRIVFLQYLDSAYLGLNGLFTNVLSILSVSEFGIASAVSYALYKPLADKDTEKVKAIMVFLKKVYFFVGSFIFVAGLLIIPLFPIIINNTTGIENINIYYLIFLFDSSIGYFLRYKTILLHADQVDYKTKKIQMVGNVIQVSLHILAIVLTRSYLICLLVASCVKISIHLRLAYIANKVYPYLKQKKAEKLPKQELQHLLKNSKALFLHKIGEAISWQTDNIIISSFLSLQIVGVVSNYTYMTNQANIFIGILLGAAIPSFGNLLVSKSKDYCFTVFKRYRLISYWVNGLVCIGYYFLSTPLIQLIFGDEFAIPKLSVLFISLTYAIKGEGTAMFNFKVASGLFEQDKYLAFVQAIINLVVSLIGIVNMGLDGVFLGTFVSALFGAVSRTMIVYKELFRTRIKELLAGTGLYICFLSLSFVTLELIKYNIENSSVFFLVMLVSVVLISNLFFVAIFHRFNEFKYAFNLLKAKLDILKRESR